MVPGYWCLLLHYRCVAAHSLLGVFGTILSDFLFVCILYLFLHYPTLHYHTLHFPKSHYTKIYHPLNLSTSLFYHITHLVSPHQKLGGRRNRQFLLSLLTVSPVHPHTLYIPYLPSDFIYSIFFNKVSGFTSVSGFKPFTLVLPPFHTHLFFCSKTQRLLGL